MDALAALRNLTLLLAEDDSLMRASLVRTLELYAGTILAAADGEQALELFQRHPVHLALLDITMPGIGGLEVAARIREQDADLPVVILTCHDERDYTVAALRLRLTAYLLKPLDLVHLEQVLERCVKDLNTLNRLDVLLAGGTVYRRPRGEILREGQVARLSGKERLVLDCLLRQRGVAVPVNRICREVDPLGGFSPLALRSLIHRLRGKIGPEALGGGRGAGYLLV